MRDQDLSGADTLKLVRYKILFVKRDYEAVLTEEKEELVAYDTTGPAWAALKICDFMGSLKLARRPAKWSEKHCDYYYPPGISGEYIEEIPECDHKYIQIYFEVLQRWERQSAEYDREQVEALRGIRRGIDDLTHSFRPGAGK